MKVVIAPDSFKESLSAAEVADHIESGFREVFPAWTYLKVPVADGGEGTVAALVAATGGRIVPHRATGPLGQPVDAFFGLLNDGKTAVIEIAAASGLMLLPAELRNPMITTTFGAGELILGALDLGARHLIVGVGGSATNDGGAGMVQALGAKLLDVEGRQISFGGGALRSLAKIDVSGLDPRLAECEIEVACDVNSPLTGPEGASAVFGPQKGATPAMVRQLECSLRHYAEQIETDLGISVLDLPGGGAAGGLGSALVAILKARLHSGAELVINTIGLDSIVGDADLVVTGEGRMDYQSARGKTPVGVASVARRHGKPVIALAGSLGAGAEFLHEQGIGAMLSVVRGTCTLEEAVARAAQNVQITARNVAAVMRIGGKLGSVPPAGN